MPGRNGAGFTPPGATIRLVFADEDWAGAEVTCNGKVPLNTALRFMTLAGLNTVALGVEEAERIADIFRQFGNEILLDWNLRDPKGKPLPADSEGFGSLGLDDCMRIVGAWLEGVQQLAKAPLATTASVSSRPSVNGGDSLPV